MEKKTGEGEGERGREGCHSYAHYYTLIRKGTILRSVVMGHFRRPACVLSPSPGTRCISRLVWFLQRVSDYLKCINLLQSPNLIQGLFYFVVISSESLGAVLHNFQHYFQVHLLYCCQINNKDLIYSVQSFIECQSYPQVFGCQATQFLAALLSVSSLVLPDI